MSKDFVDWIYLKLGSKVAEDYAPVQDELKRKAEPERFPDAEMAW